MEYCQSLDREMIAQRKLYVPALRKEGWLPYLNEGTLFQDFTGDIMLSKHYRYTPAFAHEHEFFEIMCIYDGTVKTTIQGFRILCSREMCALSLLTPDTA